MTDYYADILDEQFLIGSDETFRQALERFDTFGPRLTIEEVLEIAKANPDAEVWAFGYGWNDAEFEDGVGLFTAIPASEIREDVIEGADAAAYQTTSLSDLIHAAELTDIEWGPFILLEQ